MKALIATQAAALRQTLQDLEHRLPGILAGDLALGKLSLALSRAADCLAGPLTRVNQEDAQQRRLAELERRLEEERAALDRSLRNRFRSEGGPPSGPVLP